MSRQKQPKPPRRSSSIKTFIVFIAVILAVGAAAFAVGTVKGARDRASGPVITAELLGQQLRDAQELVSVEYYYTNMGKFENSIDFYGWQVPFTQKSFIVSYDGVIKAGVNLSGLKIDVDETDKSVTVTLPESAIISHEIEEDSLEVFDESKNIFNPITIEDYTGFTAEQKGSIEQRAIDNGLLTAAAEKAQSTIFSLLSLMPGMEEYTLTVK